MRYVCMYLRLNEDTYNVLWTSALTCIFILCVMFAGIKFSILLQCLQLEVTLEFFNLALHLVHSFIRHIDLYSAFLMLLLRSTPDPCTAKKNSFQARVECVRMNPGNNRCANGKSILHRSCFVIKYMNLLP